MIGYGQRNVYGLLQARGGRACYVREAASREEVDQGVAEMLCASSWGTALHRACHSCSRRLIFSQRDVLSRQNVPSGTSSMQFDLLELDSCPLASDCRFCSVSFASNNDRLVLLSLHIQDVCHNKHVCSGIRQVCVAASKGPKKKAPHQPKPKQNNGASQGEGTSLLSIY